MIAQAMFAGHITSVGKISNQVEGRSYLIITISVELIKNSMPKKFNLVAYDSLTLKIKRKIKTGDFACFSTIPLSDGLFEIVYYQVLKTKEI